MKKNMLWPASLVLVSAVLGACGSSPAAPAPAAIPGTTLTFALEEGEGALGTSAWTYGAGTLTLRTLDTTNTSVPGPVIATAAVSALGTGSVTLPGSAQGVVAKTNLSPKAAPLTLGDTSGCLTTLTESAPGAQALFVTGADFASDGGGVTLDETTITTDGKNYTFKSRVPVFVTQDDTVTGELKCGPTAAISVNLPFKTGWNMMVITVDTATKTYALGLESGTSLHFVHQDSATPL